MSKRAPESGRNRQRPELANADSISTPLETGRRARKKLRTREAIFSVATELFLQRGFDEVTVEEICRAADVARGTFFSHFPSKAHVLTEFGRVLTEEVAQAVRLDGGSSRDRLQEALHILARRALQRPKMVQLLTREILLHPESLAAHEGQSRSLVHVLAEVFADGVRRNEFRAEAVPRLAATVLVSAYFTVLWDWSRSPGEMDLVATADAVVTIVLDGVRSPRARSPRPAPAATRTAKSRARVAKKRP